jgi:hypothetical protein
MLVTRFDLEIIQLNVEIAFLNVKIDTDIYVKLPLK